MNILITGAAGFVGKNLVASLKNIQEKKDRTIQRAGTGWHYFYSQGYVLC